MKAKRFSALVFLIIGLSVGNVWGQNESSSSQEMQVAANASTEKELLMFFEEKDLVTATKRATPLRKAPAIATIITAEEIRNMGARDLMDVLKMVPGIGISIDAYGRYVFEVRGIRTDTSEKILVMIDGHRLNESYTGSALANLFSALSVDFIKQVEIVRGPGSALYGANAFLAVINIVTKDAADVDGLAASAAGGSFNTRKFNLLGGKESGDFQVLGDVDYIKTDGDRLLIEKDRLSASQPKVSMAPGNSNLGLEKTEGFFKAAYGNLSLEGQYIINHRGAFIGNASALTNNNFITYSDFWSELRYNQPITEKLSSKFRLYLDQFDQDVRVELFPPGFRTSATNVFPDGMTGHALLKNRTLGAEIQFEYEPFEGNHLILGGNYENISQFGVTEYTNFNPLTNAYLGSIQDISSWGNFNKDVKRDVMAMYVQDEWAIRENLNVTAGVRYDHYNDFGGTTNPRAGIVWGFMKDAELKLLYGQAFRAPNFVELYNANNPTVVGNPRLQPETIKTYEAGAGYRFATSYRLSANYFYSRIGNLIVRDTSVSPAMYENKGDVDVSGVETELTGSYYGANYWKLSYTYQIPKDAVTHKLLDSVPSHRVAAGLNYELTKYVNSHVDVLWTGSRPRALTDKRDAIPSYATVDLALIGQKFVKNLEVALTVHNLFDKRYFDPDPSGLVPTDFPRPGREIRIGTTYKF
ncbi:MAG: TonB-dependent receptor [Nitrospirae bacterium]|nr:TonB-dependent receptor [Nitrospirota bacterium]